MPHIHALIGCHMIKKLRRSVPLLTLNDIPIFTLVMLEVAVVIIIIEMLADAHYNCPRTSAFMPKAYNAVALRRAVRFDAITITILRDGKVYFGSDFATPDILPELIRKGVSEGAERKVYLRVDRDARYGIVSCVLAKVRSASVENVAFFAEKWVL